VRTASEIISAFSHIASNIALQANILQLFVYITVELMTLFPQGPFFVCEKKLNKN